MDPIDLGAEREKRRRPMPDESRDVGLKIPGSRDDGAFVCTACGAKFVAKERQFTIVGDDMAWKVDAVRPPAWGLEDHWALAPACRASLTRPAGQFDPPKVRGTQCCAACHERATVSGWIAPPCPTHAYRGCPGC